MIAPFPDSNNSGDNLYTMINTGPGNRNNVSSLHSTLSVDIVIIKLNRSVISRVNVDLKTEYFPENYFGIPPTTSLLTSLLQQARNPYKCCHVSSCFNDTPKHQGQPSECNGGHLVKRWLTEDDN